MGAEMGHVDRRTDMTKLILVCRNFAKAPKNASFTHIHIYFISNLGIPMKMGHYAVTANMWTITSLGTVVSNWRGDYSAI
jgi:hypothetical protein